jgi:hypothetical protein
MKVPNISCAFLFLKKIEHTENITSARKYDNITIIYQGFISRISTDKVDISNVIAHAKI